MIEASRFHARPPCLRLVILSNVYDDSYIRARGELIPPCLSSPKRRDLFACLQNAAGVPVILLSSPPKALLRRAPRWLPRQAAMFAGFPQSFCGNLDAPKLRIPFSWFSYAFHVLRYVRRGDVLVIDNFELIYVLAAWLCRWVYGSPVLLDYEDGKHLTDRGWTRLLSAPAEWLGKPLTRGAILAHPSLGARLPSHVPTILVPGFYLPARHIKTSRKAGTPLRFIYAGSLDGPRGLELLIQTLPLLPPQGWRLDITGSGPLEPTIRQFASDPRFVEKLKFHGVLDSQDFSLLMADADIGLNLQRSGNPISGVTFPSKLFSYLSAGLQVLSTEASDVKPILGNACLYLSTETPEALAEQMTGLINTKEEPRDFSALEQFSLSATAQRLRSFLQKTTLF